MSHSEIAFIKARSKLRFSLLAVFCGWQANPSIGVRSIEVERWLLNEVIRVAEFRGAIRHFLRENERIARRHGLTPQRYLLLLMIKGVPDGSECSTVTELTTRMQLGQSSVTELVNRAVRAGLVRRTPTAADRRVAQLRLTAEGERRLASSFSDLQSERSALLSAVARLEAAELAAAGLDG